MLDVVRKAPTGLTPEIPKLHLFMSSLWLASWLRVQAAGSRSSLTYAGPENINEPDIVYSFRL